MIITRIDTVDATPVSVESPLTFDQAVDASRRGGYVDSYASENAVGRIWQGYRYDGETEIIVTHMESKNE